MRRLLLAFGVVALAACNVQARLGETVEQCGTRYGAPVGKDNALDAAQSWDMTYSKNGLTISIHFFKGKADSIRYVAGNNRPLTLEVVQFLMRVNCPSCDWMVRDGDQLKKTSGKTQERAVHENVVAWEAPQAGLSAVFEKKANALTIQTGGFSQRFVDIMTQGL